LMFSKSFLCFCMLLIFFLVAWSSVNTWLFSLFLSYNFNLSFWSFSKVPYRFWTNISFFLLICLLLISKLENLSKIFVICTLYYATYWNIITTLLCSSNCFYPLHKP
jgi:hypothetical protein